MSGEELEDHRVILDGEFVTEGDVPADAPVITIDPFVPSRYDADSFDGLGAFPTMTLAELLEEAGFEAFMEDVATANAAVEDIWAPTELLFEYYLDENWLLFDKVASSKFEMTSVGTTRHQRTSFAFHVLGFVTANVVGPTGERGKRIHDRFTRKHLAAIKEESHVALLRARDVDARTLERDLFNLVGHYIDNFPGWSMGRLSRYATPAALSNLTLFRDEFTVMRDLYQQGFELACKCLWVLVSAQNTVKAKDPNAFIDHPSSVSEKQQPRTLAQFDKLANAFKIAYAAQVPGWDSLSDLLDNQRRNAIGHASTRHDLRSGRVVSDKDPTGISYLEFLNETHGVFEALTALLQVFRLVRFAASPDLQAPAASTTNAPPA